MLNKVTDLINKYLVPLAIKIKNIKWLSAIGDGVVATFPFLMIGSFGTLIAYFPNEDVLAWLKATPIHHIALTLGSLCNGLMGLVAAIAIAYSMSKAIDTDEFSNAITTAIAFVVVQGFTAGSISTANTGAKGLFVAMILGVLVPYFSKWIIDKGFYVKMPAGVPPMVEKTFAALVPTTLVLVLCGLIEYAFTLTEWGNVAAAFYTIIQKPFTNVAATLPSFIICIILGASVNFVGVHSTALTGLWLPFLTAASAENMAAIAAGGSSVHIVDELFRAWYAIGGFGCFMGLQVCMLLFAKSKRVKTVNRISIIPAIFNINEPVLFGFPIMLNPVMLIPFVLSPIVDCCIAYFLTVIGFLPMSNGAIISWAMPTVIRVFLCGLGWQGILVTVLCVVVNAVMYYPFFKIIDQRYLEEEKAVELENV